MTDDEPVTDLDLLAYADGRLDPVRHAQVAAYLDANPALKARIADFARQNAELHACYDHYAEAELPERMRALLRAPERRSGTARTALRAAAAVVLAIAAGAGGWYAGTAGMLRDPRPAEPAVAAAAGVATGDGPVRRASAGGTGADADAGGFDRLRRRLAVNLTPPDLRRHGYKLVRHEAVRVRGSPGVRLTYAGHAGTRLDVVLKARWRASDGTIRQARADGRPVAAWTEGPLAVAVTGTAGAREVRQVAEALRRSLRRKPAGERDPVPDEPSAPLDGGVKAAHEPDRPVLAPRLSPQPATVQDR